MTKSKLCTCAPYVGCRIYGPYEHNCSSGKRLFVVIRKGKSKETTTFARFKFECSIGRRLRKGQHVDHKNGDVSDDRLCNLQILTAQANKRKGACEAVLLKASAKISVALKNHFKLNPPNQGEKNGNSKLNSAIVQEIRKRCSNYKRGDDSKLASRFGLSRRTVSDIRRGLAWSHLK